MARVEQYPIDKKLVEEFVLKNKEYWKQSEKNTKEKIYLNFSMVRMQTTWITSKLLFAKGVSDKTGKNVVVITWRENELLTKYIESFGFEHVSLDKIASDSFASFIKAAFKSLGVILTDSLLNMRQCGVRVGNCIYEDILRTSNMSTIRTLWNKTCVKKLFHLSWVLYAFDKYLKKNPPYIAICDDVAYHEGAFNKLYNKYGAPVYASNYFTQRKISFDKKGEVIRRPAFNNDRYKKVIDKVDEAKAVQWADNYIIERFQGKNGRNIDRAAFADKKVLSKDEIIKSFNLDPNKINVVIMAHTFTDAIYNYGYNMFFKDYYTWAEETLKIASNVDSVNWILKPHPTRGAYNEDKDSIENMFSRYKKDNMVMLSDDISAETIKNIADVIVTIGGNAGAEFACFGVPAVIVGRPYYSGFGYTIEPSDYEDYVRTLTNISGTERLSDEQIITAKKVFYLNVNIEEFDNQTFSYHDDLEQLLNGVYYRMQKEMPISYFKNNDGTEKYNNETLEKLISFMDSNSLKDSEYYQNGYKIDR